MSFTSASRWRDVYLAATARAVSTCGDFLAATALALILQARGDRGVGVAALLIASALPLAVLGPLAGRLADRVDSRVLLVTTAALQAVVCTALAFVQHPAAMVALVALLAAGAAVTQPTVGALIPDMVRSEDLPKAMAIGQTSNAIGLLVGPALGGLLVGAFDSRVPLLLDAASYLALVVAGFAITTRRAGAKQRSSDGAPDETRWTFRGDRLVRTLLIAVSAVIGAVTAVEVAELFFIRETLGASPLVYGAVTAVWTGGMLLGAWPFGLVKGDDRRILRAFLLVLVGLAVVVLGMATVLDALWLVPLFLVGGALNAGLNVLVGVVLGRRVPRAVRGRVGGIFSGVASAASLVGYAIGGLLTPIVPPRLVIAGAGVASLVLALWFLVPQLAARRSVALVSEGAGDVGEPAFVGYRPEHDRYGAAATQSGTHSVPQLPSAVLGPDAVRGVVGRRPAQGHARPPQRGARRR